MIELSDVSFRGCRIRSLWNGSSPPVNSRLAFGFVLADHKIALAKGRVVRQVADSQGGGVGMVIERANVAFYEFLMTLAESDAAMAA